MMEAVAILRGEFEQQLADAAERTGRPAPNFDLAPNGQYQSQAFEAAWVGFMMGYGTAGKAVRQAKEASNA